MMIEETMSSIGERLKEERVRLGFSQPAFAGLAETTKKSQIDYEKDLTQPKAGYLAAVARVGADVQYIVTGTISNRGEPLTQDEALWLEYFRAVPGIVRSSVMASLKAAVDYERSEQLSRFKQSDESNEKP
ncbi:TPA: helix-turn-helix domain-containing protein [Pseudomonas aeruginosa]